jgi:hypothetical protein
VERFERRISIPLFYWSRWRVPTPDLANISAANKIVVVASCVTSVPVNVHEVTA